MTSKRKRSTSAAGFSMVSSLVAIGIFSVSAVAFTKFTAQQSAVQKKLSIKSQVNMLRTYVRTNMACVDEYFSCVAGTLTYVPYKQIRLNSNLNASQSIFLEGEIVDENDPTHVQGFDYLMITPATGSEKYLKVGDFALRAQCTGSPSTGIDIQYLRKKGEVGLRETGAVDPVTKEPTTWASLFNDNTRLCIPSRVESSQATVPAPAAAPCDQLNKSTWHTLDTVMADTVCSVTVTKSHSGGGPQFAGCDFNPTTREIIGCSNANETICSWVCRRETNP